MLNSSVPLEFLHRLDGGEWVGVDVVDGVEVEGGRVAHRGGAVAAAADPGKVGKRGAIPSCVAGINKERRTFIGMDKRVDP